MGSLGLFKISFQYILAENLSLKALDLLFLVPNWPNLESNLKSLLVDSGLEGVLENPKPPTFLGKLKEASINRYKTR